MENKAASLPEQMSMIGGQLPATEEINEYHADGHGRADWENIDPVTGFYNKKYGRIAAVKFGTDNKGKLVFSAVISIVNYEELLQRYGQVFCDAVLEEAAVIIRRSLTGDSIIYRNGADEFTAVVLTDSRSSTEAKVRKIIADIENIYGGSGVNVICAAGANIRVNDEPFEILKQKTHFAAGAAQRYREKYGGFVFYDEAESDGYILPGNAVKAVQGNDQRQVKRNPAVNSEIISFALKIFEKTGDFDAAVSAFMSKTGRVFDMERILILDVNRNYCSINIAYQWNSREMAPIGKKSFTLGKEKFGMIERRMKMNDFLPTDRAAYEKYASEEKGKVNGSGAVYSFQMFNGDELMGCVVYEIRGSSADEYTINILNRLAGIVSAHYAKSKTTRESRAKSEFFSKMSHEIRTPMNVIIGMTQIALDSEGLKPEAEDCLKKIDRASHYLLSLINDVLDMSRIESGKMTVEEAYIDLNELLDGVDTMIRVQTDAKGIWLRSERDIAEPYLLGDPLKLDQILINIMGNAVKFTEKGGITLSVSESRPSARGVVKVTFSIKDTGIGISEENIGKIFNSFEQADEKIVRRYGGTGLGLSISSSLAELLGGELQVKSEPGKGSEFFFTIPMKITAPEKNADGEKEKAIDLSSKRLLIAEDDELNREIIETLLGKENISADLAENGQQAVEMFENSEEGYYDAILMDIRMPVMDGIEAAGKIRSSDKADGASVPILAMTANAYGEDVKRSLESGMNGHLTKPVDMKKVMSELRRVLS